MSIPNYADAIANFRVEDVAAAILQAAQLPYVDASRIYLGGHSTGATLALLTAPSAPIRLWLAMLPADAPSAKPICIDSPALEVMTDLRQVFAVTVGASESVMRAMQIMIARRVRLLLVVGTDGLVEGLISARDAMGEKPVKLLQEQQVSRFEDLTIADLMVPRHAIDVLDIESVSRAEVGTIVETLKKSGRQHALVVETDAVSGVEVVRGIFSATQIARQLGVALPIVEVAETFAEITSALEK